MSAGSDPKPAGNIEISLDVVIVAVTDNAPRLLTVESPNQMAALPTGLLEPQDKTLELGVRRWVLGQTGLDVGYVEQLYTFGDRARGHQEAVGSNTDRSVRSLSIAYLALVREEQPLGTASWRNFYDFFPWEDHRGQRPPLIDATIMPALVRFAGGVNAREERIRTVFGAGGPGGVFDGVRVLERYELLYEAGLLFESDRHGADPTGDLAVEATDVTVDVTDAFASADADGGVAESQDGAVVSSAMYLDHRRIAATALGRLRGKLTYRPVVFELLPDRFTLLQLQQVVEALAGVGLHKQNFRRLVEGAGLVEGTGELAKTGGRPAELFRFRRAVLGERPAPGIGTPWVRT